MKFIRGTIDGDKFVTETLKLTIPEEEFSGSENTGKFA